MIASATRGTWLSEGRAVYVFGRPDVITSAAALKANEARFFEISE
jgi:hypothetical protein